MQLNDLGKSIEDMTEEELRARLYDLRHRREVERPAAKARKVKEEKVESKKQMSAAEKLLNNLSPEDLAALLREVGQ